jgi:hypothetical protein
LPQKVRERGPGPCKSSVIHSTNESDREKQASRSAHRYLPPTQWGSSPGARARSRGRRSLLRFSRTAVQPPSLKNVPGRSRPSAGNPIGPSNGDRVAGRDWWLTMLTDAQALRRPSISGRETRLGVAVEAFALVGDLEVPDGRAGNAFAEALAMNMLEVEGQFAPNNLAQLASARKLNGAGAIPTGSAFGPPNATVRIARLGPPAERGNTPPAALATSTVRREVCA